MATIDDLLNAYSSDSVPEAKKRNVELATAEKLKALNGLTSTSFTDAAIATQGSDQGSASASDIEKDLRYLSDYELRDKYGEEADYLLEQRALADIGIKNTKDLARSKTGAVGVGQDVLVSTAHGLAGLIGGLAYLGTAGADAVLGTTGSNTVAEANKSVLDWVNKGHTIYNEADTKINAEQSKLNQRDTKALHDKRMKAPDANPTEAWLRRVGQDFVDEIANTGGSAEQLTNLTGEAIGSIGGIGALTKAGTKVGTKLLNSAIERELIEKGGKTATRLQKHGKDVLTTALIGATEGGSVGAEAVNRILAMDIKSLVNDPVHGDRIKDLIAEHGEEKAKLLLAKEVGLAVTGETAVTAAILGKMVSKFEGNPLQKLSTKQAYAALVGQAIEETLQEGSGQHITNAQIKDKLNSTQDIAEGVGSGAAKGFLGGVMGNTALTPVALSRPVVDPTIAVTKYLGKEVGKQAANLAKRVYTGVLSKIDEKSPVSDTNVAKAASAILPTIPEAKAAAETVINTPNATPENIKAAEYTNKLLDALVFEAPPKGVLSPLFDAEFEGVTSTIEAAQKLSKIINDKSVSEDDRFTAIENLHGLMTGVSDALLEGAEEALPEMENLPELKQYADNFTALVNSFKDSPAMKAVMPHFENILETGMAMGHYQEIDVNNLADPAQQENLDRILKVATTTNGALPEKLGTSLTTIMDMINTDKDVGITKAQQAAIIGLATEMRIGQQLSTVAALMGLPNVDMVNRQITLDEAVDQTHIFPSAREHSRGITAAMAKEDLALAKTRLQTLQNFAVHLNNKVEALNKHIATAKAGSKTTVPFKGYRVVFGEEWSLTPKGVYVNLNSTKSKQLAKTVSLEALALTNIYNQLAKAFPELDFKSIKSVEINPVVNDGVAVNANRESIVNTSVATDTSNNTAQENTDPENNTDSIEEDTNTGNSGNDNNTEPDVHVKKWVKLITHFKGLTRLNEIKKTIPSDMGERIVKVLQGLPKDFQVDEEYEDDFKEVKEYFLGKTGEGASSGNNNNNNSGNTPPPSSSKPPVKSETPEYLDKWSKLLTYFKGLARLNEVKKDISTELGESVVKVLESLPKDFQVDEEYQDDFNEIKEYFLGKPEEETTSLKENPELLKDLQEKAKGKTLTDKFASTDISQERALSEPLNQKEAISSSSNSNNNNNTTDENPSNKVTSENTFDAIKKEERAATENSIQETTVKPTENSKHVEKSSENSSNNSIKTARTSSSKISKNTESIDINSDHVLSPDYLTSIETLQGTFDSPMQAIVVSLYGVIKRTPENHALMLQALETTDPDKLREILGSYKTPQKTLIEKLEKIAKEVYSSYIHGNAAALAEATKANAFTLNFSDQNKFWQALLPNVLKEIAEEIKLINEVPYSEEISTKANFKELLSNLVLGAKSRVFNAFSLGSDKTTNLLNQTSPLGFIIDSLDNTDQEESTFKIQAKKRWKALLAEEVPNIVNTLGENVRSFLQNKVPVTERTKLNSIALIVVNSLKEKELHPTIKTILDDLGITNDQLELYTTYAKHEATVKANEEAIKDLLDAQSIWKKEQSKQEIKTNWEYGDLLQSREEELVKAKKWLAENSLDEPLAKFRSALVKVQGEIPLHTLMELRELHQTPNGKLMNFLVQTDGNYDLDPRIAEAITIAGISWIAGNATNGTSLDRKELADVLNMEVWEISGEALRTADKAVFSGIVTQGVADSIRKILNLGEKQNGYIGDTQGLLLSLSANVVEALKDNGLLDMHTINAMDKETKKIHKSFNYYRATPFVGTIYSAVSEVIEDIVVEEHLKKPRFSLGSPHSLPIPNKLKHSSVDVTSDQKIMVENANRVPTFVNLPIYNFFKAIGTEGLVKLFAHGELDEDLLHPEDYISKLGKNRSISDAWEKAEVMLKDIAHFANKREKGVDQIPIYFGKAVNSTSRLDFEESYNIQASKVNRPVFVATRKLVNLTSNKNKVNFLRGIAQGMGIKIHNLSAENALAKLQAVLETPEVVNALKLIGEHKEVFTEEDINILKAVMPFVDNTEWGLTNLVEYQRYIATPEKDLHKFVTPVAIEADGATNGVANSLHLLTNTITTRLIQLWKMTGFFIGSDTRSLNEEREFNPTDIYLSAAKGVTGYLDTYKREFYKKQPEELFPAYEGGEILTRLLNVTVTVDSAGNIELTRPSTKNPVTVSVYRSSVNGIAEKVTGELVKELYTQISLKLQGTGNLMIPTYYEELVHAFNLIDDTIKLPPIDASNATWRAFSLDSFNLVHIVDAIKYSYAQPLYNVISDQVLGTVNLAANTMVKLANMQGALIKEAYERAIREKIEDKLKNEPSYRRSDYLTHKELKDISADIIKRFGGVINDTYQNATVFMKSVKSSVAGMPHTAASLQDTVRAYPSIETFGEPGVSIVPNSVIRGGDALMIQHFINDPENDIHNLPIFDGIMVNVKDIEKASLLANKAVYRTWTEGTPMEAVVNAFEKALASVEFSKISTETANAIMTTSGLNKTELQNTSVKQILEDTLALAKNIVIDIKAQQEVVKRLPSSVDQMASIGNPYHAEGTLQLSEELIEKLSDTISESELAEALETERAKIASDMRKAARAKGKSVDPEEIPPADKVTVLDSTNASEILFNLASKNPKQLKLIGVVESVIGSFKQSLYTILQGNAKAIQEYFLNRGDLQNATHVVKDNEGFINYAKKVIVIKSEKVNVLLHEMIHASTINSIKTALTTESPKTAAEKRAVSSVKQIKIMFSEFISDEFAEHFKHNSKALNTYLSIKKALLGESKDNEFIQLSEFVAHVLADENLLDVLTNVPTKATIASKFLEGIRKAIARFFEWSGQTAESKDFFTTLVFHTTTLAHDNLSFTTPESTLPINDYALDSRLDTLHAKLKAKFKDKLSGANVVEKTQLLDAALKEKKLADDIIAAGFYLDQEELNLYAAMNLAMKIGLDTNAVARTQLQEVFAKILQNIKVSHFYSNANPTQDEKDVAADKLHAVFGRYQGGGSIRQDTLANFIALATVSPELQKIINEIAIQEFGLADNTRDAFDLWVGNLGNKIIDNLSDYSSKVDKRSKELDTYFNALVDVLFNAEQDSKLQNNALLKAVGSNAEKANDWLVDNLQKGSQKANELTQPLRDSSNKLANFTGNVVQTLNAIVNKDIAEIAVQDINRSFNRVEGFQEFRDFLKDIFGRTEDNAKVYDLVKPIRTYVDKVRQAYKGTVPVIIKQKFTKPVTKEEYAVLSTAMGKTMLHTLGSSNMIRLATGKLSANSRITQLEDKLKAIDADYFVGVSEKAKQLAEYNINGIAGDMLLRNPYTIAYRFDGYTGSAPKINPAYVNAVAELISLYSYELLSNSDKETLNKLATQDPDALVFMGRFLNSIHEHDAQSLEVNLTAKANSYFGHLPQIIESEGHLRIANDSEFTDLVSQGYVRVGDYVGDSRDPLKTKARGYYYNPLNTGLEYKQGIIQTIQGSAGGVDLETGLTVSKLSAGLISDPAEIKRVLNGTYKESDEPLLPVFNGERKLIAFERTVSNKQLARLELNKDLPTLLGAMRGRQAEENLARTFLNMSLDALVDTYENDPDKSQYIDLFDKKAVAKDKVLEFGVSLFSRTAKDEIKRRFGDSFYVKREMLTDVVGFRKASVTDVFTGISRYSPETIKTLRAIALSVFGENAYKYMAYSEKYLQEGVSYIKGNIIVRSVVVPVANILSNAMHLLSLGIPLQYTLKAIPKKIAELEHYSKARVRLMSIEIEMDAANKNDSVLMKRLIAEKKSLESTLERMSIAPLIIAGELSNINDVGLDDTDKLLFTKRLGEYFSTLINKTPKGVKTVGKHLLVAENTALYAGLQKSVLYGDFIAKAIQYDYLTQVKKVKSQEAIVTVSSEFISYDHLPGRGRDYLESMGLLWFYNYKLRSVRVALNVTRNNPLYGLIYGGMLGTQLGIDSPLDSNVVSQVFDGTIGNSLGIGMGIDGIFSNPYVNLIT